ncbi:ATP-binding protein [Rheinheimera sp.]|uniref:ATP-binding protein n=1 Tax=Rheinheimera sp. TaxID=1869214 RepID=UPI00307E9646
MSARVWIGVLWWCCWPVLAQQASLPQLQQQYQRAGPDQQPALLLQLAEVAVRQNPALSLDYAQQWRSLTPDRQSNHYARLLISEITAYMLQGQYQMAYQLGLELEPLARQSGDQRLLFNALRRQADNLNRLGQSAQALPIALQAMQIATDSAQTVPLQIMRYDLAHIYINLFAYPQALEIASAGLTQAMQDQDSDKEAGFLHLLSEASRLYQQYSAAEDFGRRALSVRQSRQEPALLAQYHLSLARTLLAQRNWDAAQTELEQAWAAATKVQNAQEQADALLSQAELDLIRGQPDAASQRFEQIRQLLAAEEFSSNLAILTVQYLNHLVNYGQPAQAAALYQQKLQHYQPSANTQHEIDYLLLSVAVRQHLQQYQQSAQLSQRLMQLQQRQFDDKLAKQALVISMEQHKTLLQRQLQEAQQAKTLNELEYQHRQRLTLAVATGVLLASALLLSLLYHKNRRSQLKLRQEQLLAQQKIAIKNEFIASLGHEIRSPLQGIHLVIEQLSQELRTPAVQQKLQLVIRSLGSLDSIISNILTSSRLEHGEYQLNLRPVALTALARQLQDLLKPLAQNKGLQLHCHIASAVPALVMLDENLLTQLLTNLISNAVKYTEQGEIELRIELQQQKLWFKVRDTGVGLTQLQISQLLRGERLEQQRPLQAGPGLGIVLCQKLLAQADSVLHIHSVPGHGTEASFALALTDVSPGPELPVQLQHELALVVDDDPLCRVSLVHHLTELGFRVQQADSLTQLQQMPLTDWGWLFLDGHLSDGSSSQVLDWLRAQHRLPAQCRVVLVSGSADGPLDPSVSTLLLKPWRREQLQAVVSQLARVEPLMPLYDLTYLQQNVEALTATQRQQLMQHLTTQFTALQHEIQQACPDAKLMHRMIGTMGQLGLLRLAQLCRLATQSDPNQPPDPWTLAQLRLCLTQSQQIVWQQLAGVDDGSVQR